ncbi:hypothetical protein EVC26_020 [Rhizobium phage RHph_I72]|nr:hypothetical protein EVC26_020 [Rhizobium phage RHph_I72]
MRYVQHIIEGGPKELMNLLNSFSPSDRVIHIEKGRFGKWHGLDEEYEWGYMVITETVSVTATISVGV